MEFVYFQQHGISIRIDFAIMNFRIPYSVFDSMFVGGNRFTSTPSLSAVSFPMCIGAREVIGVIEKAIVISRRLIATMQRMWAPRQNTNKTLFTTK